MKLEVAGGELFYEKHGEQGPWVMLVNGHTRSSSDFRSLMRFLVGKGFRVATFDNRGAGKTVVNRDFLLEDMVHDLDLICGAIGANKLHILGVSMGGVIAQHFAAQNPEKMTSLTLVSTTCQNGFIRELEPGWGESVDEIREKLLIYFADGYYARNKLLVDSMVKQIHAANTGGSFDKMAQMQRQAMNSYDTMTLLDRIACPTLILHGEKDKIIAVEAAKVLAKGIANSLLKVYPDFGHLLLAEAGKTMFEDFASFLRKVSDEVYF